MLDGFALDGALVGEHFHNGSTSLTMRSASSQISRVRVRSSVADRLFQQLRPPPGCRTVDS